MNQKGKGVICKTGNLYLVSFRESTSSITPSPESLGPEASLASGNTAAASSSSDSVLERSDELVTGKFGQESWENAGRTRKIRQHKCSSG